MDPVQRRNAARKVEIGGQVGAAVAGIGLGGAKLRDAYVEDHPAAFRRGQGHLYGAARKVGASRAGAVKLTRIAGTGKPHFAQIAAGASAAAVATGAQRYQSYSRLKQRREESHTVPTDPKTMSKSAFGVEHEIAKAGGARRVLRAAGKLAQDNANGGVRVSEHGRSHAGNWARRPSSSSVRTEHDGRSVTTLREKTKGGLTLRGKLAAGAAGAAVLGGGEEGTRRGLRRSGAGYPAY